MNICKYKISQKSMKTVGVKIQVKKSGPNPIGSRVFRLLHGSSIPENGPGDWI